MPLPLKWPPPLQIAAVLCIIAFMAVVLFPVFVHAPNTDGRASCMSNLEQLGLADIQYEQDADETFPPGVGANGNGWAGQLYGFTKSTGVYRCPKDASDPPFISYAENRNLAGIGYGNLALPAATVALYEFSTPNCDPSTPEAISATGLQAPPHSARHLPDYGLNFLLTDGHVKMLTPEKVSGGPGAVSPKALPSGAFVQTFAAK